MELEHVMMLIWVIILFFSVIILFFVWAKSVVIIRMFARVRSLLHKMNTLYDKDAKAGEENKK